MAISLFEARGVRFELLSEEKIANISAPGQKNKTKKTKDTLLSQTLKVEENKVSLVFLFVTQEPRYGHFIF